MADFQVVAQFARDRINSATNRVERVMQVSFRDLVTGVEDSVDVPMTAYSADSARILIESRLGDIRAVHSLGE